MTNLVTRRGLIPALLSCLVLLAVANGVSLQAQETIESCTAEMEKLAEDPFSARPSDECMEIFEALTEEMMKSLPEGYEDDIGTNEDYADYDAEPPDHLPLSVHISTRAREQDDTAGPTDQIYDDETDLVAVLERTSEDVPSWFHAYVYVSFEVVDAAGRSPGDELQNEYNLTLSDVDPSYVVPLTPRGSGMLGIGDYKIAIRSPHLPTIELPFVVVARPSSLPLAERLADVEAKPGGFNVALSALGGSVVAPEPEGGLPPVRTFMCGRNTIPQCARFSPHNLVDGLTPKLVWTGGYATDCRSCGWKSETSDLPADLVFRLPARTTIHAVIVDPGSPSQFERLYADDHLSTVPRFIEVATAGNEGADFTTRASVQLHNEFEPQLIRFPAVDASLVKVRVSGAYSSALVALDEVSIIETPSASSVVDLDRRNLASPDLGGVFVQAPDNSWRLVDGVSERQQWQRRARFPTDFVLAFRDDLIAHVKSVEIHTSGNDAGSYEDLPHEVSIAVSTVSPAIGFREVGRFELEARGGAQSLPVDVPARFLRLRVVSNRGGKSLAFDELRVIEKPGPAEASILAAFPDDETRPTQRVAELPSGHQETEPNDAASSANELVLDALNVGRIASVRDVDRYRLSGLPAGDVALKLMIHGFPEIRTDVSLFAPDGSLIKQFRSSETTRDRHLVTWHLRKPGDYMLEVRRAPLSLVIELSGLRETYEETLSDFVRTLRPEDEVNLIRTESIGIDFLLPDFTSDKDEILAAAGSKAEVRNQRFGEDRDFWNKISDSNLRVYSVSARDEESVYEEERFAVRQALYAGSELLADRLGTRAFLSMGGIQSVWHSSSDITNATSLQRHNGHIAIATGGQQFLARSEAEYDDAYAAVAGYLDSPALYGLTPSVVSATGELAVVSTGKPIPAVSAPTQVALILDASGSMKREIEGRRMIDIAKDVMVQVVDGLPEDSRVALRVFGHRVSEGFPGDCQDTEVLVPFADLDREGIREQLLEIDATGGTTLIGYTLRQLGSDFGTVPGRKLVVLVTDGEEECESDLPSAIRSIEQRGIDLRLNIVGFALTEQSVKDGMAELAGLTGGRFFDATDPVSLETSVGSALDVPFDVVDSTGAVMSTGSINGDPIALIEGSYKVVVATMEGDIDISPVLIAPDRVTRVDLNNDGMEIGINIQNPD